MLDLNRKEKVFIGVTAPVWVPLAAVIYVAIAPIIWVAKVAVAVEQTSLYQKQKRKRDAKPPEVKPRQRVLSISNTNTTAVPAKDLVHQDDTAEELKLPNFFRLPRELRLCIYEEIIGKENIHIMLIDRQIRSFRCKDKNCHNAMYGGDHCYIKYEHNQLRLLGRPKYTYHHSGINVLPLLQSCKAVYADMIDVLYSTLRFQIHDYDSLFALSSTILPHRFHTIRNLHIDGRRKFHWGLSLFPRHFPIGLPSYRATRDLTILNPNLPQPADPADPLGAWALSCQLISGMEGLRELVIDMDYPNRKYIWDEKEWKQNTVARLEHCLIEPMRALHDMELLVFKVRFEHFKDEAVHWLDMPFVEVYPSR